MTSLCAFPTCEDDDDENSEDVRIIGQDSWGVHWHVELAEVPDLSANQFVECGAPRSGHARSSCGKKEMLNILSGGTKRYPNTNSFPF